VQGREEGAPGEGREEGAPGEGREEGAPGEGRVEGASPGRRVVVEAAPRAHLRGVSGCAAAGEAAGDDAGDDAGAAAGDGAGWRRGPAACFRRRREGRGSAAGEGG
jgi:hypothetical protein